MQKENSKVIDFIAARRALRPVPTPCPAGVRGARARIYRPAGNVRQRGPAEQPWVLAFEPCADPAAGPLQHVRLSFPTREQAVRFAERRGWPYAVEAPPRPARRRPILPPGIVDEAFALGA